MEIRAVVRTLLVAVALLWASAAAAQDPLRDGERLVSAGQYQQALEILLPAYMNSPGAQLAYIIARAYDGQRDDSLAERFYKSALSQRGLSRKAKTHAKRRLKAMKQRLKGKPQKATLSVVATVSGALVVLDGDVIGRTPLTGILIRPGRHTIEVKHERFETWSRSVNAQSHEPLHLDAKLEDKPTDVLVNTQPAGATATMPGGQKCVTPCLFSLRAGRYRITLQKAGHKTVVHDFDKPAGRMIELRLDLTNGVAAPVPTPTQQGFVSVVADRAGADVAINGRPVGRTPLPQALALPAGMHRLTVTMPGFQPFTRDIAVVAGRTNPVSVALIPVGGDPGVQPNNNPTIVRPTPIITRPRPQPVLPSTPPGADKPGPYDTVGWALLWTGVGTVVAGGGLTTWGLLNQRKFNTAVRFKIENELYVSGLTRQDVIDLEGQTAGVMYTSYALYGVGAALIVTGAVLLSVEPEPDDPFKAPSLGISPVVGPGLIGASAEWRF